jgi:hypothetical protein
MTQQQTDFWAVKPPIATPTVSEIIERRKREFELLSAERQARRLIDVVVRIDGPYAICHFGDPHIDDPGTDISLLECHVRTVASTRGMFAGNIGDNNNNWVGRLERLHAKQTTTAKEAWLLVEWLMRSMPWLYVVSGNHGAWSGDSDPLEWILQGSPGVSGTWGVRLNLKSPNGSAVRVNARHDFDGHSIWNEIHGPKKAAKMGWRDHILICGHKHTSGYGMDRCPATGLISHIIRVAGYKVYDDYADQLGLPNQASFPSCVTIIDPDEPDDSVRRVTFIPDVEAGADYLTWLRSKRGC